MSKGFLTTSEVAEKLDISTATVRRWIRSGKLSAAAYPSGQFRVPASEVERIMTPVSAESPVDGEVSLW